MSKWTGALHDYTEAAIDWREERLRAQAKGVPPNHFYSQALAQAADVLDREHEAVVRRIAVEER